MYYEKKKNEKETTNNTMNMHIKLTIHSLTWSNNIYYDMKYCNIHQYSIEKYATMIALDYDYFTRPIPVSLTSLILMTTW